MQCRLWLSRSAHRPCRPRCNPSGLQRAARSLTLNASLRLVEIEEHLPLCIERRLRRVEVLRSGLVVDCIQQARGKRDRLSLLIADWEGNPLTKTCVQRAGRPVVAFLRAEEAARTHHLFAEELSEAIAHVVEALRGIAEAEGLERIRNNATRSQVFSRARRLGRMKILLKILGRRLVNLQQLLTQTSLTCLLRRRKLTLRQRNSHLCGDGTHRLREAGVIHLHYEGEHVAVRVTAEAVVAGRRRVEVERA